MTKFEEDLLLCPAQCQAKSKRTGKRCRAFAMRGMRVCYHHGGKLGSKKAQRARLLAVFKHGMYTKEAIVERKMVSKMIKDSRQSLKQF